jgi:hypothetical protein
MVCKGNNARLRVACHELFNCNIHGSDVRAKVRVGIISAN